MQQHNVLYRLSGKINPFGSLTPDSKCRYDFVQILNVSGFWMLIVLSKK
jgi:hypothetical protein